MLIIKKYRLIVFDFYRILVLPLKDRKLLKLIDKKKMDIKENGDILMYLNVGIYEGKLFWHKL